MKIVMGDFNAKLWKLTANTLCCGKYGLGKQNERGTDQLDFCETNNLVIALNTILVVFTSGYHLITTPN